MQNIFLPILKFLKYSRYPILIIIFHRFLSKESLLNTKNYLKICYQSCSSVANLSFYLLKLNLGFPFLTFGSTWVPKTNFVDYCVVLLVIVLRDVVPFQFGVVDVGFLLQPGPKPRRRIPQ